MSRIRWCLTQITWAAAALWRGRRPVRPAEDDVRRIDFPTQTKRTGLTMTPALRDRLRPRWLRVVPPDVPRD